MENSHSFTGALKGPSKTFGKLQSEIYRTCIFTIFNGWPCKITDVVCQSLEISFVMRAILQSVINELPLSIIFAPCNPAHAAEKSINSCQGERKLLVLAKWISREKIRYVFQNKEIKCRKLPSLKWCVFACKCMVLFLISDTMKTYRNHLMDCNETF